MVASIPTPSSVIKLDALLEFSTTISPEFIDSKSVIFPTKRTIKGRVSLAFLKPSKIPCKPTQGLVLAPVTSKETVFLVFSVI